MSDSTVTTKLYTLKKLFFFSSKIKVSIMKHLEKVQRILVHYKEPRKPATT